MWPLRAGLTVVLLSVFPLSKLRGPVGGSAPIRLMRGVGEDDEGEEEEGDDEAGGMVGEERSVDCEGRFVGPPFSELRRARGPVGGALPDIVEPKLADVVEEKRISTKVRVARAVDRPRPTLFNSTLVVDTRFASSKLISSPFLFF